MSNISSGQSSTLIKALKQRSCLPHVRDELMHALRDNVLDTCEELRTCVRAERLGPEDSPFLVGLLLETGSHLRAAGAPLRACAAVESTAVWLAGGGAVQPAHTLHWLLPALEGQYQAECRYAQAQSATWRVLGGAETPGARQAPEGREAITGNLQHRTLELAKEWYRYLGTRRFGKVAQPMLRSGYRAVRVARALVRRDQA